MAKKIWFASEHTHLDFPAPAKNSVADWYKKSKKWANDKVTLNGADKGIKHCVPFLDAMTNGYMVTLWQDIEVRQVNGSAEINWNVSPVVVELRTRDALPTLPTPAGHGGIHFVWKLPFSIKTPAGYSLLAVHPLNRYDLPFTTMSALIDADSGLHPGNVPFFIQDGFEGIIPMGTPILQLIPVKRESWRSEENKALVEDGHLWDYITRRVSSGAYKALKWKKKDFQ